MQADMADIYDNMSSIVKDGLVKTLHPGDRVSIAAALFSIYGYAELKEELNACDSFRFIYTEPTFLKSQGEKERREYFIPRLERERGIGGTELEIRLKNELKQKALARECADWIRQKGEFRSYGAADRAAGGFLVVDGADPSAFQPVEGLTTSALGTAPCKQLSIVTKTSGSAANYFLDRFNRAWDSGELEDVTQGVIDSITTMYRENPPELIYYAALYRIFHEFLEDVSEDDLAKEGTGFKKSSVWNLLYDFQKDAVLAIINKLQAYDGCILADSVGLGKTFTALAVIKYYELLNKNVLVLCPKRLSENWLTYKKNYVNNPIAGDRLSYDVLYHTDLSRESGKTVEGIDLERFNWGAYDLVVIDESHNFRNGFDTSSKAEDEEQGNRFKRLLDKVVMGGVHTKVLMLSATPVNNRFRDLHNQLKLAYQGNPDAWAEKLGLDRSIDQVFREAQKTFKVWSELPPAERNTRALTDRLDFNFFQILDRVTVARSRSHVQRYYDTTAIGSFPKRKKPLSLRPSLSTQRIDATYSQIAETLAALNLAVYLPTLYLHPSAAQKYADDHGRPPTSGRERGMVKLMFSILLKRLESSIHAFGLTLDKIIAVIERNIAVIDAYRATGMETTVEATAAEGYEDEEVDFAVGTKNRFSLADMDWMTWESDMRRDLEALARIRRLIAPIDAEHDAKLAELKRTIADKVENPLNPGNKKVLVFTAFADTADYLYENIGAFVKQAYGLEVAEVAGGSQSARCSVEGVRNDMDEVITCFSPVSKGRDATFSRLVGKDIDILIATDCISEGQNLQDCDCVINYDIHWNPVRIVQRFGRVDRIGSKNEYIQLVNFWPDVELDEYINLKARVENKMHALVMASTGDDDYINEDEKGDLEYRRQQLERMRDEVVDLEDAQGGISITDLGLNDFRMDLVEYTKEHPEIERVPYGLEAVVAGEIPGTIFVLRNTSRNIDRLSGNAIHPFYLVYVSEDGRIVHGYDEPKEILDEMKRMCRHRDEPLEGLCRIYNAETDDGHDMRSQAALLGEAVASIVQKKGESDIDSFFGGGTTGFLENDIEGLDDFELVCFLVVRELC